LTIAISVTATTTVARNVDDPTIDITPVAGDSIICVAFYIDAISEGDWSSVTDSESQAYTQIINLGQNDRRLVILYHRAPNITATTITLNTTAATDTILMAWTMTGTLISGTLIGDTGAFSSSNSVVIDVQEAGSAIIYMGTVSNDANDWTPFGTGQIEITLGNNGGAEKFSAVTSIESPTLATGNDTQSSTPNKTTDPKCVAGEIFAEPAVAELRFINMNDGEGLA